MPLLRYQMGDTAVFRGGTCGCGRGGALVERIVGRVEDVIVTPDGRWLSRLDFIFKGLDRVEEAQLIQEEVGAVRVRIVKRQGYTAADEKQVLHKLKERLGEEMKLSVEYLDRIPRTSSGKFRYVISKVPLGLSGRSQTGQILDERSEEDATL
jgi:phenylacetate-CoA ligase